MLAFKKYPAATVDVGADVNIPSKHVMIQDLSPRPA